MWRQMLGIGVGGGETHAQQRVDGGHPAQQFGEIDRLVRAFPQVAVDVLAEERHLFVSGLEDLAGLPDDGMGVAGTFGAAGIGDDAVGTDVVAAAHDGDEGGDAEAVGADGADVGIGLVAGELHVHLGIVRADGGQQTGKAAVGVRAHDKVHHAAFQQLVLEALGHAADDADKGCRAVGGPAALLLREAGDAAVDALLGVVADRAGVREDEVRLLHHFRPVIAVVTENGEDDFGVTHVHLASVGLDIYKLSCHLHAF